MANVLLKSCVSSVGIWLSHKRSFQIILHTAPFSPTHAGSGALQSTDTWKGEPVGLAAEQLATWPLDALPSFRKRAGAVICHRAEGFFPSQPSRKRQRALPKSKATTRNTQKQRGKLLSSSLMQKKSAKSYCDKFDSRVLKQEEKIFQNEK
jgi:hypothetical protein